MVDERERMLEIPDADCTFFDDDGNALNPDLVAKPDLCVSCATDVA